MRTLPPRLPGSSPEPPGTSLLPPFPAPPAPAPPAPMVPGPQRPAPRPIPVPRPARRPLPDVVALPSRLPLPPAGPSFDDQAGQDLGPPRTALSAAGPRTGPRPARAPRPADGSRPPGDPPSASHQPAAGDPPSVGDPPSASEPEPGEWASRLAQALAEALAGSRPPRQIAPWTTEQARRRIRQLGPALQAGPRPVVRRVLTSAPHRDVVEMTVIIGVGPRTRAIAVRLERGRASSARPGRGRPWVCTAIEAA